MRFVNIVWKRRKRTKAEVAAFIEDWVNDPSQGIVQLCLKHKISQEHASRYLTDIWFGVRGKEETEIITLPSRV